MSGARNVMKASDLKRLEGELAEGYRLVPLARRQGRYVVEGPDGKLVPMNADRSGRPMVVGKAGSPAALTRIHAQLRKAGALR